MSRWTDPAPAGALWGRSVGELQALYTSGTTVRSVVEACVARAAEAAELNAVAVLSPTALQQGEALDTLLLEERGPLHGIPILVKDNMDVAGEATPAGSPVLTGAPIEDVDSVAVARLRAAGAVILGRSTMHEFAWGITSIHPTLPSPINPIDSALIAGGSSGGAGVAVAVGIVPIALGSDTAGSVRIPAAFCGVTGLKGAWEWIPTEGSVPLAPSLDAFGALACSVEEVELACAVMAGVGLAALPQVSSLRIGVGSDPTWPRLDAPYLAAMTWAAAALAAAGASVSALALDAPERALTPYEIFGQVQPPQALAVHHDLLGTWPARRDAYGSDVAGRLEMAAQLVAARPPDLQEVLEVHLSALRRLLEADDVVLLPVSAAGPSEASSPELVGAARLQLRETVLPFTVIANLIGAAAIALPSGVRDQHGIPVSVQLIAGKGALPALIAAAKALERARQ